MEDEVEDVFTIPPADLLALDFAWIEPQPLTFWKPHLPQSYVNPIPEPIPVYPVIELPEDIIAGILSIIVGIVLSHTENDVTPLA